MSLLLPLIALAMQPSNIKYGFDQDRLSAIGARLREFVGRGLVSGVVVRVLRHGKLVYEDAVGFANIETKAPMRPDTIFQIMSMTKPITAIAITRCAEEGLLSLDDPVEKYLPGLKDAKVKLSDGSLVAPRKRPTIRHLLTHTGGFNPNDPGGLDDDSKRNLTLKEYADLLQKEPLIGQPGEAIRYSGPGFAALGRIVEIVSKVPFEAFLDKKFFQPLGMKDTSFFEPEKDYPRIATMYDRKDGKLITVEPNPFRKGARFANPAGGLYSTAKDMATLLNCINEGGRPLLSPAAVEVMTTIQTGSLQMDGNDSQGFGLGFAIVKSPEGQMTLKPIGAYGHSGAYGTEFWADRGRGIVAVYMAQSWESEPRKVFNAMVNAAFVGR